MAYWWENYGWRYVIWTVAWIVTVPRYGRWHFHPYLILGGYLCVALYNSYRAYVEDDAPLPWDIRGQVERWRRARGLCVKCGYDLRATPERCPECGTPNEAPIEPDIQERRDRTSIEILLILALGALVIFIVLRIDASF